MGHQPAYKYGKSITTIAELSRLSISTVSRALDGQGTSHAARLAFALDITIDQFYRRFYSNKRRHGGRAKRLASKRRNLAA